MIRAVLMKVKEGLETKFLQAFPSNLPVIKVALSSKLENRQCWKARLPQLKGKQDLYHVRFQDRVDGLESSIYIAGREFIENFLKNLRPMALNFFSTHSAHTFKRQM